MANDHSPSLSLCGSMQMNHPSFNKRRQRKRGHRHHHGRSANLFVVISALIVVLTTVSNPLICQAFSVPQQQQAQGTTTTASIQSTTTPPLLNVPTYALATLNDDNVTTNMNILTFATPVSISPHRIWCLGLYKETLSHFNWQKRGRGILQLLSPHQYPLVSLLGGTSGRDLNKMQECAKLGFPWVKYLGTTPPPPSAQDQAENEPQNDNHDEGLPTMILPGCVHYLEIENTFLDSSGGNNEMESDFQPLPSMIDLGSHKLVICTIKNMMIPTTPTLTGINDDDADLNQRQEDDPIAHLTTAELRELGIITKQGRVAQDQNKYSKVDP